MYAVAVNSTGRVDDALKVLKQALVGHPNDRDLQAALVSFGREAGAPRRAT